MPPPGTDPPTAAGGRGGSSRRDPLALLGIAALLLVVRVGLGVHDARVQPPPAAGTAAALSGADEVRWRTLEEGVAEMRATGRPILYDFTAEWCPPCRALQRQVFSDPQAVAEIEGRYVPVRVLDRQREEGRNAPWVDSLQARYRVSSFPTLVVAGPDGGESARVVGFMGRDLTLGQLRGDGLQLRWGTTGSGPPAGR